jgi:hypothetical protein
MAEEGMAGAMERDALSDTSSVTNTTALAKEAAKGDEPTPASPGKVPSDQAQLGSGSGEVKKVIRASKEFTEEYLLHCIWDLEKKVQSANSTKEIEVDQVRKLILQIEQEKMQFLAQENKVRPPCFPYCSDGRFTSNDVTAIGG